jgi:hypothetical protein
MSSWWSSLNPFVEVHAEEAADEGVEENDSEEKEEGGDDESTHPNPLSYDLNVADDSRR